jgi:hypothetical protein
MKKQIKSPITGNLMTLKSEKRDFQYHGKVVTIEYKFYECEDSGEQFVTTELGDRNLEQVRKAWIDKVIEESK